MNAYDDDGFDEWLERVNAAVREITPDMALTDWCDCNDDAVREFYPLEPAEVVACLRAENPEFRRACRRVEGEIAADNAAHE